MNTITENGTFYSYDTLQKLIVYGGSKFKNLCNVLKYLSHNNTYNFEDWFPIDYTPKTDNGLNYKQEEVNCSCSHDIIHCFTVVNKYNNNSIIVGSSCIKKFFGKKANKIKTRLIDEYKGKIKCPYCKKTISKPMVEKYKHKKNIYHKQCYIKQCYIDEFSLETEEQKEPPPPSYETLEPVVVMNLNTIVNIKKFKGKPLSDLLKDVGYCNWIKSVESPFGQLKEIQEYLIQM